MVAKQAIWKYALRSSGGQRVQMPKGAVVLSVQNQLDVVTLWALVDPHEPLQDRTFYAHLTGDSVYTRGMTYLGTVQLAEGSFVAHIFEVLG